MFLFIFSCILDDDSLMAVSIEALTQLITGWDYKHLTKPKVVKIMICFVNEQLIVCAEANNWKLMSSAPLITIPHKKQFTIWKITY